MATGLYPIVPHLGMIVAARRAGYRLPRGQVRSALAEWSVAVTLSAARPLGFLPLPGTRRQRRGPRPVIMLHGYAMNRANFIPLARRLSVAGLGPMYGFEYWSLGKTASAARRLGEYVERLCARTGSERVDLVGHSMGGMVARYYVSRGRGADRVRNLITIGSPHRGTDVSAVGFGRPGSELAPNSSFLQRLEAAPVPAKVRITAILSRSDALVPTPRGRWRGVEQIVYDDLGHLSMLASRRVANEIISRLSQR